MLRVPPFIARNFSASAVTHVRPKLPIDRHIASISDSWLFGVGSTTRCRRSGAVLDVSFGVWRDY